MGPNLKGKVVSASSKAQQESTFFRKLKRFLKRSKGLQVFFLGGGKVHPRENSGYPYVWLCACVWSADGGILVLTVMVE